MKYHLNGIKHYISLRDDLDNIIKNMTMKIFEVEDDVVTTTLPDLLVIGYVDEVTQHPNADKLKVCQINCGSHGHYQICTGGENIAQGHYVPVALPGCYLPAIDLKIEPRPMRGEESNGMICSKEELGIKEDMDKHWIWHLDEDLHDLTHEDIGLAMKDKYPWMEDTGFEVKNIAITTRPDLTGYWGVACELNAVYAGTGLIQFNHIPQILDEIKHLDLNQALATAPNASKSVTIDTSLCGCYSLIEFDDVQVTQSDLYQRMMVYATGSTPRNNWVDWSNNFMNLTGQPIHCFDKAKLVGNITVMTLSQAEQFVDLMGNEHTLQTGDILIRDEEKIIALAGIIGGINSSITDDTGSICIEVAQFDPTQVRKTATRLSLRTDAAVRYEKYINPYWTQYCSIILAEQVRKQQISLGNAQFIGISHISNQLPHRAAVSISINKAQQFIRGDEHAKSGDDMKQILQGLGFVVSIDGDTMTCMPPIWRSPLDITHAQDIYEEIARIVGYENIGTQALHTTPTPQLNPIPQIIKSIEDKMILGYGYDQVETYLWTEENYLKLLGQYDEQAYTLLNPLSPEQTILRPMLYPGLIKIVSNNHRMHDTVTIFETAHVINRDGIESHHLCWVSYVSKSKQVLEDEIISHKNILHSIVGDYSINATTHDYLHPTKQGEVVVNNEIIGLIGQIHPLVCDELGLNIDYQLVVTEINLTALIVQGRTRGKSAVHNYLTNQHHIITRDVSFGLTGDATYKQVLDVAQSAKGIDTVEVFDLYQPSEDLKTIGVRFTMIYDEAPNTEAVTKKIDYITQQIVKIEGVSVR